MIEMARKKNKTSLLDSFEIDTEKEHDAAVTAAVNTSKKTSQKTNGGDTRATALVSMTKDEKERLTTKAKAYGLSLSAFFRLAADEYMNNHNW